jgi:NDP-sugar pyrophosphorylase family protein
MKAGIIAAGIGQRLAQEGVSVPKPLVPVGGEPMIARVIRTATRLKPSSVACIVNDFHPEVSRYLRSRSWPVPLELVVKTTPSSLESLFTLAPLLDKEPFLLFTVDAIFPFEALQAFLKKADAMDDAAGVLALTPYVDDEKPLWAACDSSNRVIALGEKARPSPYVTAGFYLFKPRIFEAMKVARERELGALRHFLALLVESHYPIYGVPVGKTMDVDTPEDVRKAEAYLKEIGEGKGA